MKNSQENFTSYVAGFVISVALTLCAYFLVVDHAFLPVSVSLSSPWMIAIVIAVIALIQFVAQLFFFMHLRLRTKPRWQLFTLLFMIMVVLILVIGSLWIMYSLNGRMQMTPDQVQTYMQNQAGI